MYGQRRQSRRLGSNRYQYKCGCVVGGQHSLKTPSTVRPSTVRPPSVRPSTLAQATNQKTVNKILSNQNICTYICSFLYYWQYYVLFFFISRVFLCLANQNWCRKTINQSNRVSYNKPGGWVEFFFGGRTGRSWRLFLIVFVSGRFSFLCYRAFL